MAEVPRAVIAASFSRLQVWKETKEPGGEMSSVPIQDLFSDADFGKSLTNASTQFAAGANRRFQFQNA